MFYNIEIIDEAIENGKQIKFTYNKYGADKKLHRSATHTVSPYQMILHNQHYFLMAYQEKWQYMRYFRVDKISEIGITENNSTDIKTIDGYKNGIDYKRFSSALPYMFSDKPEQITFLIDGEWILDHVVDWFGYGFKTEQKNGVNTVTLKASPDAMEYWAMQYLNGIEILSPTSLRERIANNVAKVNKKYNH